MVLLEYLHCEAVLVLNILLCVTLFFLLFVLILLRPSNIWWKWSNTQQTQKSLRGKFKIHCCYHSSILWIQTVSSSWAPLFIIGFYSDCRIILYPILKVELLMSSQQSELLLLSVMEAVCLSQRDSDMYVQIYRLYVMFWRLLAFMSNGKGICNCKKYMNFDTASLNKSRIL